MKGNTPPTFFLQQEKKNLIGFFFRTPPHLPGKQGELPKNKILKTKKINESACKNVKSPFHFFLQNKRGKNKHPPPYPRFFFFYLLLVFLVTPIGLFFF